MDMTACRSSIGKSELDQRPLGIAMKGRNGSFCAGRTVCSRSLTAL